MLLLDKGVTLFYLSPTFFRSQQRGRSDSIDSRKTTSSLVVDDVRQSPSAEARLVLCESK